MDEKEKQLAEILDKVQGLPDSALIFIGVIAFIILAGGFLMVIWKLIQLQMNQNKQNAEIAASQQSLMVESNRQTELMRMAFDQHNNLERERNRVIEAQSETIQGLQRSFLEKLPQLIEAGKILFDLTEETGQLTVVSVAAQSMLRDARTELSKLAGQVVLLVDYTRENQAHQELADRAVSNLAYKFAELEEKIVKALGIAATNALPPASGTLSEMIIPPGSSEPITVIRVSSSDAPTNLTNIGE